MATTDQYYQVLKVPMPRAGTTAAILIGANCKGGQLNKIGSFTSAMSTPTQTGHKITCTPNKKANFMGTLVFEYKVKVAIVIGDKIYWTASSDMYEAADVTTYSVGTASTGGTCTFGKQSVLFTATALKHNFVFEAP
jgi:hypothetical protein